MMTNVRMLHVSDNETFETIATLVSRRTASLEDKYPEIHGLDAVIAEPHKRTRSGRKHDVRLSVSVDHRGVIAVHGQEPRGEFDNPLSAVDHAFDMLENRILHTTRERAHPRREFSEEAL